MSENKLKEVEKSMLIAGYLKSGTPPALNALLDWRNQLVKLRSKPEHTPVKHLYNIEIKATDYIIQEHYS